MHQFAARENVLVDELAHAWSEPGIACATRRDAMVHDQPAWTQQAAHLIEVSVQPGPTYVFEHADGRNLVPWLAGVEGAVVLQQHAYPALQPAFFDQPVHVGMLVLRERDAGGVHTVVLGRP